MKKIIRKTFIIFVFILLLGNSIVNADMGPKPSITIHLKGMNTTNYIIDLLVYDEEIANQISSIESILEKKSYSNISDMALLRYYNISINDSSGDENSLPSKELIKLAKINDNGWVSESTRWGKFLLMSNIMGNSKYENYFRYFGTPEKYKVVIINNDTGETKITDVINRKDFNSQITIDVEDMKVTNNINIVQHSFNKYKEKIIPLLITLFLELMIAFTFNLKNWKNYIIILITNIVTNLLFQFFIINIPTKIEKTFIFGQGLLKYYSICFLIGEIIVYFLERKIYLTTLKDLDKKRITKYTLVANIITALSTIFVNSIFMFLF